jgi:phosphoglycolate phosphatase-like HAD superfamily hydrolase
VQGTTLAFSANSNPRSVQPQRSRIAMTSSADDSAATDQRAAFHGAKGIIFDIDGTLADSWKLGFDATQVVLIQNQIDPITPEVYHDYCIYATPERLARHAGLTPLDGAKFETVGQTLGNEFDSHYVGLVDTTTAGFFPGIRGLLQRIMDQDGVKLAALTNACVAYGYAVLQANLDERGYQKFGSIKGADNVPNPKPSPDGLFEVCKELGFSPSECIYIGDSPSDAGAAKNAGMPSIGVLWGSNGKEKLQKAPFDCLCESVEELGALLGYPVGEWVANDAPVSKK